MSRYFQTLNRLQRGGAPRPADQGFPVEAEEEQVANLDLDSSPGERVALFPEIHLATRSTAWSNLLDLLRAQSHDSPTPTIVLAGVSHVESVDPILAGLAYQAQQRGLALGFSELVISAQGRFLRQRVADLQGTPTHQSMPHSEPDVPAPHLPYFELSKQPRPEELQAWLQTVGQPLDMMIVKAPGVLTSADTLLLAGACDGLALVVRCMVTSRSAIESAIERARIANCRIVGLVMTGHRDWLPNWLGRFFKSVKRSA